MVMIMIVPGEQDLKAPLAMEGREEAEVADKKEKGHEAWGPGLNDRVGVKIDNCGGKVTGYAGEAVQVIAQSGFVRPVGGKGSHCSTAATRRAGSERTGKLIMGLKNVSSDIHGHGTREAPHPVRSAKLSRVPLG
ncbi:hypothetical protein EI90DRAFT_3010814 [Cantharellus anzutake]|nr:hypothetical protein EI90DRAFT_3010814 [Cantharellus anzutake]